MKIRRAKIDQEMIGIRVPADVMREIRILLLDPATGRIGYSRLQNLITELLTDWLEKKKKRIDNVTVETAPVARFEEYDNEGA